MVWTGLHVAPHATANVFSIRCLISRELASDEACWQRNGRESFRRLHQMAALLRHLGQNLVDGELAAGTAFFFFLFPPFSTFPPSLTKCPRPHIHQTHIWFFSHSSVGPPHTASSCHPPSPCHSATWVPSIACPCFLWDSIWCLEVFILWLLLLTNILRVSKVLRYNSGFWPQTSVDSKGAVCPAPWVLCPHPSFTSFLLLFLRTMGCMGLLGCEIF